MYLMKLFSSVWLKVSSAPLVQKSDTAGKVKKLKKHLNAFGPVSPVL